MSIRSRLRADLGAALVGPGAAPSAADRLCAACVDLLEVDGAALSLIDAGGSQGTLGSSGAQSRRLDELQFTFGEGPCLDAVASGRPILVGDVADRNERRWPAFVRAVSDSGVRAVFALPVSIARKPVGALDLFRNRPETLSGDSLDGGLWAAELAAVPLLDLLAAETGWAAADDGGDGWERLEALERVEVYQATGMIIAQLDVSAAEALVRLRAYAFSEGVTASEAAWAIVDRRVVLDSDDSWPGRNGRPGSSGRPGDGTAGPL